MNIELVKWSKKLKDDLIRICNSVDRTDLSDRLPDPYTPKDADEWLQMVSECDGVNGLFRAISVDGRIAGSISIEQKSGVFRKDAEIGYMLTDDVSSRGIMTIATKQICEMAFKELDIVRITGLAHERNTASRRVLEKNGFILEGIMKNAAFKYDELLNLCVYGLLKGGND